MALKCVIFCLISSTLCHSKANGGLQIDLLKPPNILLLLADDVGYGDFQSFGHPTQEYGGVDRMVNEGMKFTQWYAPSAMCSPSRLAMLTGRYAFRSGYRGTGPPVFLESSPGGIPRSEITIAESLKTLGYTTGIVGKWHLGINKHRFDDGYHLPRHHGFDYVGTNLPLSNREMCNPDVFSLDEMRGCFAYNDTTIIEQPVNLTTITQRMIDDTKYFISSNENNTFFMFVSFLQAHTTLFCEPRFCGKSKRGIYGDNINEMSSAVSDLLEHLIHHDLHKNTLVLFISDQGAILDNCPYGGNNGPFRGGKGTTWEGGFRIPAVAWWPGVVPAGTASSSVISTLDLHPTFIKLGQGSHNNMTSPPLDGQPIREILCHTSAVNSSSDFCKDSVSPRILFYYNCERVFAVRYGDLKVHYATTKSPPSGRYKDCLRVTPVEKVPFFGCNKTVAHDPPIMYNVATDPSELLPLDASLFEEELNLINRLVEEHEYAIEEVPALLQPPQDHLRPCCNPPHCHCNYAG